MKKLSNMLSENNSNKLTDYDIILGLTLVNPDLLEFTQYQYNQYLFKSHVLQTMIRHTSMQFKDKLKWNVPNKVNSIDVNVEKDWKKLQRLRNNAVNLRNKYEEIKNVTFTESGLKINETENLKHNNNKNKQSSRKIFDSIFGVHDNLIYQHEDLWDKLIQSWIKLVFKYASPETRNLVELFIFDNQLDELSFKDYRKITANSDYKYLGVHVKGLDKHFKKLHQLLSVLYKNPAYWTNHQQMQSDWQATKNHFLNKHLLLPLFKTSLDNKSLRKSVLHFLADNFDLEEGEYTNIRNLKHVPSRNSFLDNNVKLTVSFWNNKNFDFIYLIKCLNLQNKEIGSIEIEVSWPSGTPENKLVAKAKLHNLNLDNLMPNVRKETE